jgi:putative copper resistance protein D
MVEAVSDLIATTYGRILCAKLALFATMLVLAFVNRRAVVAREKRAANDEAALRTLRAGVVAEIVVGAAILVVVAWLGVTPPVAHDRAEHRMEGM